MLVIQSLDLSNIPVYPFVDAARYLKIPVDTLRSWVRGRSYNTSQGKRYSEPLIELSSPEARELSFTNLVEAHVLRAIRVEHKIRLDQIRIALNYISLELKYEHPLVREDFLRTDGKSIYVEHLGRLLDASKNGQIAIRETLEIYLTRIEVDEKGIAARLFPFIHSKQRNDPKVIVIDPNISFGRPVIAGTRIPTGILADRARAGESANTLARDFRCDISLVEIALEYEGLAA
jgi:uncharacterized protein (DUF433 family)